ncbi:hypothetical protein BC629DRAFT_1118197 [Irpex lacteus]|nr:hypothetical protein BC629DRAFT_1118197 [Irpex lacteus]
MHRKKYHKHCTPVSASPRSRSHNRPPDVCAFLQSCLNNAFPNFYDGGPRTTHIDTSGKNENTSDSIDRKHDLGSKARTDKSRTVSGYRSRRHQEDRIEQNKADGLPRGRLELVFDASLVISESALRPRTPSFPRNCSPSTARSHDMNLGRVGGRSECDIKITPSSLCMIAVSVPVYRLQNSGETGYTSRAPTCTPPPYTRGTTMLYG